MLKPFKTESVKLHSPCLLESEKYITLECKERLCGVVRNDTKTCNKRPRGLDALLGHLLVKRIPVLFQHSSTKIPEYLSQK